MIFRSGLKNPEGPVSLPDGTWLVTEMDIGAITHISQDGKSARCVARTPLPNGLAVDESGCIWVADAKAPALFRINPSGLVEFEKKSYNGMQFLLPNDLCFGPEGWIYLTDSGILLEKLQSMKDPSDAYDLDFDGKVYRISRDGLHCEVIDSGLRLTNGIAFGLEGHYLYVAETITGNIYRYKTNKTNGCWKRELFGNVMKRNPQEYGRIAGPDGMAFDTAGNLYVTVVFEGHITILNSSGGIKDRIETEGHTPTNMCFDRLGSSRIFVTEAEKGQAILLDVDEPGLTLYY